MSNSVVTIGNTDPDKFADWLDSAPVDMDGLGISIIPSVGYWNGVRESSITVTFFNRTPFFARSILNLYGNDHPEEEAFGLLESTFSQVVPNDAHSDIVEDIPNTFPEGWN